jgi:antirestriction protein
MSNQVTVKVHCKNTDQWYDIDSSTDVEALIEEIQESLLDGEVSEKEHDNEVEFDQMECSTSLISDMIELDNLDDLPAAIEALENADQDIEVYEAYAANMGTRSGNDLEDIISEADEAYQGEYDSDEKFAQEMADQLGSVDHNASWPMNCIDWEFAAKELMYDYFESNGHYFRNI